MGALRKLRRAGGRYNEPEPLRRGQPLPCQKMSEVLLEFAQPMLDAVDDDRYFKMVVQFAALCWDIAIRPEHEQKVLLNKMLDDLCASSDLARAVFERCAGELIARRRALFHDDKRAILGVEFVDQGEDTRVLVMSALPPDTHD